MGPKMCLPENSRYFCTAIIFLQPSAFNLYFNLDKV